MGCDDLQDKIWRLDFLFLLYQDTSKMHQTPLKNIVSAVKEKNYNGADYFLPHSFIPNTTIKVKA
jgi:hypothetical protein